MPTIPSPQTDDRERAAGSKPPVQFNAEDAGRPITPASRAMLRCTNRLSLLVIGVCIIVHGAGATEPTAFPDSALPAPVAELRELILAAVQSGNIDDLGSAFEHSSSAPDLGSKDGDDPIATLKRATEDGSGLEALAAMGEILRMAPAALPLGKDLENNLIFVWPYLAEQPPDKLSPREQVDLLTLVQPSKAAEMREKMRWTWWRLAIGADGTWLMFKKLN